MLGWITIPCEVLWITHMLPACPAYEITRVLLYSMKMAERINGIPLQLVCEWKKLFK